MQQRQIKGLNLLITHDTGQLVDRVTRLFSHHRLFDHGQVLEWAQQKMRELRAANVLYQSCAQFFCQCKKHLVFVVQRLVQERNELVARTFRTKRKRNR